MMSGSLQFEGTVLEFIERDGDRWLRMAQLAHLLGYEYGRGVGRLYIQHRDWFKDGETALFLMDTVRGHKGTRVFSFRGAWRLSALAKSVRAKRFQMWALDIIERENEERDERLAAAESRVRELRSIVLASKPGWNKIARYWGMGYPIERIAVLIAMSKNQTRRACAELVAIGILHPRPESDGDRITPTTTARQCSLPLGG